MVKEVYPTFCQMTRLEIAVFHISYRAISLRFQKIRSSSPQTHFLEISGVVLSVASVAAEKITQQNI
jgi:hypothetical protein